MRLFLSASALVAVALAGNLTEIQTSAFQTNVGQYYRVFRGTCTPAQALAGSCTPVSDPDVRGLCRGGKRVAVTFQGFSGSTCAAATASSTGNRAGNIETNACIRQPGGGNNDYMILRCNYDTADFDYTERAKSLRAFYYSGTTGCNGADCCTGVRDVGQITLTAPTAACNDNVANLIGQASGCALESGCARNAKCTSAIGCTTTGATAAAEAAAAAASASQAMSAAQRELIGTNATSNCLNGVFSDGAAATATAFFKFTVYGGCIARGSSAETPAVTELLTRIPCLIACNDDPACAAALAVIVACGTTAVAAGPGGLTNAGGLAAALTTCGQQGLTQGSPVQNQLLSAFAAGCSGSSLGTAICAGAEVAKFGARMLAAATGSCTRATRTASTAQGAARNTNNGGTNAACCDSQAPGANGCCNQCFNPTGTTAAASQSCVTTTVSQQGEPADQSSATTAMYVFGAISTIIATLLA